LALNIGFQYREPEDTDDCWEAWVYPAVQEIVGGKHDGETGWSGFNFDLSGLLEEVEAKSLSISARMGQALPELVVEGISGVSRSSYICAWSRRSGRKPPRSSM